MGPSSFSIDLTDPAEPSILINGQDVTRIVQGLVVSASADSGLPTVTLQLSTPGAIEGLAVIQEVAPADLRTAMLEVLDNIDPETLNLRAMELAKWGDSVAAGFLAAIREMFSGD